MDQYKWNLENIKSGLESFLCEYGHYPTSQEIDQYELLPSSRQIQRRFAGLVNLRGILKLPCPEDFTKGEYSSKRAKMIGLRAHDKEKEVYKYLTSRFGTAFVHREYFFTDDSRARTDFFIHCKDGNFSVDVFFPRNRANFINCLNSKMRTYSSQLMLQYPVIFLMVNDEINDDVIEKAVENKKNKLQSYQRVMSLRVFKKFCSNKKPHQVK